jgi:peptidoglycan/LPS O-acetylase OafA/YrhL
VSHFFLSPGISPELTDIVLLLFPLALILGYLLDRDRGFPVAFAAATIALGAIKFWTDYTDLYDVPVALGGVVVGAAWMGLVLHGRDPGRALAVLMVVIGVGAIAVGALKAYTDPLDPFDLLQAVTAAGAGLALIAYRFGRRAKAPG